MGAGLQDTIGLQDNIYTATPDINKHETENPKKAKAMASNKPCWWHIYTPSHLRIYIN